MPDYDRLLEMVQRLVDEAGAGATWRVATTSVDPSKPWNPVASPTPGEHAVRAVLLPMNTQMLQSTVSALASLGYIQGTNLPKGMAQVLIAGGLPFEPNLRDTLVLGRSLKPLAIDVLRPGDVTLLYTVQVQL